MKCKAYVALKEATTTKISSCHNHVNCYPYLICGVCKGRFELTAEGCFADGKIYFSKLSSSSSELFLSSFWPQLVHTTTCFLQVRFWYWNENSSVKKGTFFPLSKSNGNVSKASFASGVL